VGLHGEYLITGDILKSRVGVWGDTWMYVGPLMGDIEPLVVGAARFVFDDGSTGIFTRAFDLDTLAWIRGDGMLLSLRHGGDMSIFIDNEELILQIARTLRVDTRNPSTNEHFYIYDLFDPKSEVILMEGMEETIWLFPYGEIRRDDTAGLGSYVIYIQDFYLVEQRDNELSVSVDWDFPWDVPAPSMDIRQFPNVGVEEMGYNIINGIDLDYLYHFNYSLPTDDFPFFVIELHSGTEWNSLVVFTYIRDNTRGGVFVITTQHSLEAMEGHGALFSHFIGTLEIIDF